MSAQQYAQLQSNGAYIAPPQQAPPGTYDTSFGYDIPKIPLPNISQAGRSKVTQPFNQPLPMEPSSRKSRRSKHRSGKKMRDSNDGWSSDSVSSMENADWTATWGTPYLPSAPTGYSIPIPPMTCGNVMEHLYSCSWCMQKWTTYWEGYQLQERKARQQQATLAPTSNGNGNSLSTDPASTQVPGAPFLTPEQFGWLIFITCVIVIVASAILVTLAVTGRRKSKKQ